MPPVSANTTVAARVSSLRPGVTALGGALTGVAGAFLAARDDPFGASLAALAFYKLAGARAARGAQGPGSYRVAFLDALAALEPADEVDLVVER